MPQFYDLTHGFDEDTYHPFGFAHFENIQMFASHGCRHAIVTMSLHFGTHMDAPWHMVEKGRRLDGIDVRDLIGDAVVVDLSATCGPDKGGPREISLDHLKRALSAGGLEIRKRDALIVHTGWAPLFKSEPTRYYQEYRTLEPAAARWLVESGARLFGIDAPDVDLPECYRDVPFAPTNHRTLLGSDVYVVENVGGEILKVLGRRVLLIPANLKLGGEYASGAPVRLLAQG
jgi:arylformamidase